MPTFSQTFCLEEKCSFPLGTVTSDLSDFADFPLPRRMRLYPLSPSSCGAAAACQCKQLRSPPCQPALKVQEQWRLLAVGAWPCRMAVAATRSSKLLETRIFGAGCRGDGHKVLSTSHCACPEGIGIGAGVLLEVDFPPVGMGCVDCSWVGAGYDACSLSPVSSCSYLRGPALERGSLNCLRHCKHVQHHPDSDGVSSGEPLAPSHWQPPLAGDSPVQLYQSVEQYSLQGRAAQDPHLPSLSAAARCFAGQITSSLPPIK